MKIFPTIAVHHVHPQRYNCRWKRSSIVLVPAAAAVAAMMVSGVDGFQGQQRQYQFQHQNRHRFSTTSTSTASTTTSGYYRRTSLTSCERYSHICGDDHDDVDFGIDDLGDNVFNTNDNENDCNVVPSSSSPYVDRRRAITYTGATALSLWFGLNVDGARSLASSSPSATSAWAAAPSTDQQQQTQSSSSSSSSSSPPPASKTILITGCNTGIGFEAARILARQGNTIVMACRTLQKAAEAAKKIQQETPAANLIPAECDLASLESIKSFVQTLKVDTIDVACYNAGISLNQFDTEAQRTKEGFELTVGTNHLGHFYLNSLLLPTKINKSTGKIVVTASAVHDPESPGGAQGKTATLGDLEGFIRDGKNFEMVDGQPFNGDKAYKDSKLCNVFFCRELQRRLSSTQSTKDITVNSFSPGLITTTGLFRYQSPIFIPIFSFIATKVAKVAETPEWGGAALAYMTQVDTRGQYYNSPPGSSKYGDAAFGKQFTIYDVSKEAHDDAKSRKLWELSEKLVGV